MPRRAVRLGSDLCAARWRCARTVFAMGWRRSRESTRARWPSTWKAAGAPAWRWLVGVHVNCRQVTRRERLARSVRIGRPARNAFGPDRAPRAKCVRSGSGAPREMRSVRIGRPARNDHPPAPLRESGVEFVGYGTTKSTRQRPCLSTVVDRDRLPVPTDRLCPPPPSAAAVDVRRCGPAPTRSRPRPHSPAGSPASTATGSEVSIVTPARLGAGASRRRRGRCAPDAPAPGALGRRPSPAVRLPRAEHAEADPEVAKWRSVPFDDRRGAIPRPARRRKRERPTPGAGPAGPSACAVRPRSSPSRACPPRRSAGRGGGCS